MSLCLERMSGCNYYQLLGLDATATSSDIRRAYLRLSLQWHPDKRRDSAFPSEECDNIFRSIQEAYETLSCPEKRCLYDFVGAFAALADATASSSPRSAPVPTPTVPMRQQHVAGASSLGTGGSSADAPRHLAAALASASPCPSRSSPSPSSDTCLSTSPATRGHGTVGMPLGGSDPSWLDASSFRSCGASRSASGGNGATLGHTWYHMDIEQQLQPQQSEAGAAATAATAAASSVFLDVRHGSSGGPCPQSTPSPCSPSSLLGKRRTPYAATTNHPQPQAPCPDSCPGPGLGPQHPLPQPWPQDLTGSGPCPPPQSQPLATRVGRPAAPLSAGGGPGTAGGRQAQSADVYYKLLLTLEEIYCGCVKQLRLARRVFRLPTEAAAWGASPPGACSSSGDGGCSRDAGWVAMAGGSVQGARGGGGCWRVEVEELFRVVVQPGWRDGTKVTFRGKGDELPGGFAGDMVLVVTQAAHGRYERRGNNLYTVVPVSLVDALTGGDTAITTLDGRTLVLRIGPACLQPFSEQVVKGEGMPIPPGRTRPRDAAGGPAGVAGARMGVCAEGAAGAGPAGGGCGEAGASGQARGDLHVRFEVSFPTDLTSEQKEELRLALGGTGDSGGPPSTGV